jgi:molybdate transport system substrate-binding protein
MTQALKERIVRAPPGVPVASLVAEGKVTLGFQQLPELVHVKGIRVLGPLPAQIQLITTFSAGVSAACRRADAVRAALDYMVSPGAEAAKKRNGMERA